MEENICHKYLVWRGEKLDNYYSLCDALASNVAEWARKKGLPAREVMIARSGNKWLTPTTCITDDMNIDTRWCYHVVVEVDGLIHDPWFPEILTREEYLKVNFGHHDDVSADFHNIVD